MATGCYVTSVGSLDHKKGRPYPPSGHPGDYRFEWEKGRILADTTLVGISRGGGVWETRHASGRLEPGCVLFLPAGEWHRYRPNPQTGWREQWLCLRGDLLHRLLESEILPAQARVRTCNEWAGWEARLNRLREEILGRQGSNRLSWGARALSIVLELWEPDEDPDRRPTEPAAPTAGDLTRRALGFIERNSHRPILVEDVAQACGRTRRTLERLFHKARLGSILNAICSTRIARAKHLLRETHLSIKQVAGEAGFASSQHFIACFRRCEKCTPSEYRRNRRPDDG